ncbi:MAG: thioesterase, partial [Oscillospiraceae bacterium]
MIRKVITQVTNMIAKMGCTRSKVMTAIIRPKNCIYKQFFLNEEIEVEKIKITAPDDVEKVCDYTVSYKDLDRYDHMNNTVYCDITQSVVDFDYKNSFPSEFNIYFRSEAKLNDIIE